MPTHVPAWYAVMTSVIHYPRLDARGFRIIAHGLTFIGFVTAVPS